MSTTTASPPVTDDGSPSGGRLRRWRPLLIALAAFLVVSGVITLLRPTESTVPLAIDNPHPAGAQALAQLLRDEGVSLTPVTGLNEALHHASASAEPVTIAVIGVGGLSEAEREALAHSGADVTVIGAIYADLTGLTQMTPEGTSVVASTPLAAECTDADALASQSLAGTTGSVSLQADSDAVGCFPLPGHPDRYAWATDSLPGGGRLRVVADSSLVTNERLATAGHAALAMRSLGHHEQVIWFDALRAPSDQSDRNAALPPWLPPVMMQIGIAVALLALVQGRRFGPLVYEALPVVVRSTETTAGRGRLYRRAKDRDRAAQALRAGTALRLGRRLGLMPAATMADLVDAVSRASGLPPDYVRQALDGPPPLSDRSLMDLAAQLDRLESEVSS